MTLSKSINNPRHWLDRAAEVREIADTMKEGGMKTAVLKLASDYEKLAARAIARTQGVRATP
ncbi:MAG TPA: hypothetical protein VGG11_06140 [Xanthobacteraceae bacterium]|jgi:hypothetical protein